MSKNEWWRGTVTVTGNVTVPSGITLTVDPGTTINIASGSYLNVYGTLNASGTSSNRITFTCSSGTWGGIRFYSNGTSGHLSNCNITNASTYGIYISSASPYVGMCNISSSSYGVYITGSTSWPQITQNYIQATTACVYHTSGGNGYFTNNSFRNSQYGSYVVSGSPRYDYYNVGRNKFESTLTYDKVRISAGQPYFNCYQYFTVPSSTSYRYIRNSTANSISATYNYWSTSGAPSSTYFTGTVNYTNYLTSVPTNPAAGPTWTKGSVEDIFFAEFEEASELFYEKKFEEARDYFKKLTTAYWDTEYSSYALNWYMLSTEQLEKISSQTEYLISVIKDANAHASTKFYAKKWLLQKELREGTIKTSKSMINSVAAGSLYDLELSIDLALGLYDFYADKQGAEEVLTRILSTFKDDATAETVEFIRGQFNGEPNGNRSVGGNNNQLTEELTNKKFAIDNYPNPFNPTTTIKYTIPEDGVVAIKVFDVLGREIQTLVNQRQLKGDYSVEFNASNLASGMYIYRMQVNDYVMSKKMVLLR